MEVYKLSIKFINLEVYVKLTSMENYVLLGLLKCSQRLAVHNSTEVQMASIIYLLTVMKNLDKFEEVEKWVI